MNLIKLTTKNFKKLRDFTAEFSHGLNVIVGENAQGKSTLLQAIEAALFGVTVVPGKKETIPTWGQSTFSLELAFEVDGLEYHLTRTKSTAKLLGIDRMDQGGLREPVLLANGNTPVTAYVEQLLGLTAKDFSLFVQSRQGETSGVLTFGATALNNKVEEFAGISLIDGVKSRAQKLETEHKASARALEVSSEGISLAEQAVNTASLEASSAEAEHTSAQAAVDNYPPLNAQKPSVSAAELSATQRKALQAESALREAEAAEAHCKALVQQAEQALTEAGSPVDVESLEDAAKKAVASLRRIRSRLNEVKEQIAAALHAEAELDSAQYELAQAPEVPPEELEEAERTVQFYRDEQVRINGLIAVVTAKLADLNKLAGDAVCPTCGTTLADHDPDALEQEIEAARKEKEDLSVSLSLASTGGAEKRLKELQAAVLKRKTLQAAVDKWQAKQTDLAALNDLKGEDGVLTVEVERLQGVVADLKAKLEAAESDNRRVEVAEKRLKKAQAEYKAAIEAVSAARSRLLPNPPTDAEIDAAHAAETAYQEAVQTWKAGKQSAEHVLLMACSHLNTTKDALRRAQESYAGLVSRAESARQHTIEADRAGRLARFLGDRRGSYLKDVWTTVLAAASRQVQSATRGTITRIAYGEDGFSFEEDGVLAPVAAASGAQKAFIGSAVRIGLARALYGSDSLLIFDEPTESMSEHNATGLAASLAGCAKQLLLITHREQDQALAKNIIQVGV